MRLPLAAVLLSVALSPALAASREDFSPHERDRLLAAWMSALASLESGRELAAFVAKQPVEIRVDRRLSGEGLYEDGRVYVHQGRLLYKLDEYERLGLKGDEAVDAVAWDSLHVLAHELEHARTRHIFELTIGSPYDYTDQDDELLSFAREVRVVREIAKKHPQRLRRVAEDDKRMTAFYLQQTAASLPTFEDAILSGFRHVPRLRDNERDALRAWARDQRAYWAGERNKKLADSRAPVAPVIQDMHRRDAREAETVVARLDRLDAVVADSTRFALAKAYFTRRHEKLAAEWPGWFR